MNYLTFVECRVESIKKEERETSIPPPVKPPGLISGVRPKAYKPISRRCVVMMMLHNTTMLFHACMHDEGVQ